jgi:hypothetical protein
MLRITKIAAHVAQTDVPIHNRGHMVLRQLIPAVILLLIMSLTGLAIQTIRVDVLLQQVTATVTVPMATS